MVPAVNSVLGLVLLVLLSCAGPWEGVGPLIPGMCADELTGFVLRVRVQVLSAWHPGAFVWVDEVTWDVVYRRRGRRWRGERRGVDGGGDGGVVMTGLGWDASRLVWIGWERRGVADAGGSGRAVAFEGKCQCFECIWLDGERLANEVIVGGVTRGGQKGQASRRGMAGGRQIT